LGKTNTKSTAYISGEQAGTVLSVALGGKCAVNGTKTILAKAGPLKNWFRIGYYWNNIKRHTMWE